MPSTCQDITGYFGYESEMTRTLVIQRHFCFLIQCPRQSYSYKLKILIGSRVLYCINPRSNPLGTSFRMSFSGNGYASRFSNGSYQSQAAPRIFASVSRAVLSSSSKAEVTVESMSITATTCSLSAHLSFEVVQGLSSAGWRTRIAKGRCYLLTDSYRYYYFAPRVSITGNVVWEGMHILPNRQVISVCTFPMLKHMCRANLDQLRFAAFCCFATDAATKLDSLAGNLIRAIRC